MDPYELGQRACNGTDLSDPRVGYGRVKMAFVGDDYDDKTGHYMTWMHGGIVLPRVKDLAELKAHFAQVHQDVTKKRPQAKLLGHRYLLQKTNKDPESWQTWNDVTTGPGQDLSGVMSEYQFPKGQTKTAADPVKAAKAVTSTLGGVARNEKTMNWLRGLFNGRWNSGAAHKAMELGLEASNTAGKTPSFVTASQKAMTALNNERAAGTNLMDLAKQRAPMTTLEARNLNYNRYVGSRAAAAVGGAGVVGGGTAYMMSGSNPPPPSAVPQPIPTAPPVEPPVTPPVTPPHPSQAPGMSLTDKIGLIGGGTMALGGVAGLGYYLANRHKSKTPVKVPVEPSQPVQAPVEKTAAGVGGAAGVGAKLWKAMPWVAGATAAGKSLYDATYTPAKEVAKNKIYNAQVMADAAKATSNSGAAAGINPQAAPGMSTAAMLTTAGLGIGSLGTLGAYLTNADKKDKAKKEALRQQQMAGLPSLPAV